MDAQTFTPINVSELVSKVGELKNSGYRMVQICAAKVDQGLELTYSFDKEYGLVNLRFTLPSTEVEVPSVSGVYWNSFLYENELHDLFGIKVTNINVDYKGKFYKTSVKWPFNPEPKPAESAEKDKQP